MTGGGRSPRWRQRLLVAVVAVVTVGTVVLVGGNAAQLGLVSQRVTSAQSRSASLGNAMREVLILLQVAAGHGETGGSDEIEVHRGLLGRQLTVAMASFPPGAAEVGEIMQIKATLADVPWDLLSDADGHDEPQRVAALSVLTQVEHRVNGLFSAEEQQFYRATIDALDANQRSQAGLAILVAVVLALGAGAVLVITRRSRSTIARAYDALRASEGRFRSLVQRASDLTVVTDREGVVTYASPAAGTLLGVEPDALLRRPLLEFVEQGQRAGVAEAIAFLAEQPGLTDTIELRLLAPGDDVRLVEAVCRNLLDDADVAGLVWNGRDATDRRVLEQELTYQALHDPLTGLPNRTLLLRRLGELLRDRAGDACVLLIDLDGFKNVNDTLGHPAGDELLRTAAARLLGCLRNEDMAARLGGDEFAVLVATGAAGLPLEIGRRLVDVLSSPFAVSGREVRISGSIGIARGGEAESADSLLRDADIAMYVAKNTGKGRLVVFEPGMRDNASHRTDLEQQLAAAVELRQIEVHYQPIVELATLRPMSLEALVRWRRPDGTLLSPAAFIPAAEESGAIHGIGREVLRQACREAAEWPAVGGARPGVSVNVSAQQVLSGRLVGDIADTLRDSGLVPSALTLEIVESSQLTDAELAARELALLRELGVHVAVDDFGSGYSSLGFLMGLAADTLKIDRTLLEFDTTRRGVLVNAVAELGRTLGLTVVVEGVETAQHLARAREARCDAAQGFHFSRPLPADEVASYLRGSLAPARGA